jgi:hypothetical protein
VNADENVILGNRRINFGVIRIEFDGFLIILNRARESFFGLQIPVKAPSQECFVGFGRIRAAFMQLSRFFAG